MNTRRLSAISVGHFAIDILNSSITIILVEASRHFGLSNSQIGFGAMIYTFAASLTQPLFGLLADRLRGRWLAAAGLLWTMIFYGIAVLMPTYPALIAVLTVAALGSGAFHPAGIVNAGDAGGQRRTTATSVFFLLGQSGLSLGPVISGIVLQRVGMSGLPFVALAMTPAVLMMAWALHAPMAREEPAPVMNTSSEGRAASQGVWMIAVFLLVVIFRSTTLQSYMTLLPKYFADMGLSSGAYGAMVGVFTFAGALGTFFGGFLGDRFERRTVVMSSLLASIPFSLLLLGPVNWFYYVAAALSGALLSIPHSILLVAGQDLLPRRKGMMGGIVLGLMFASGAATAWIASWFADRVGLGTVLYALAFFPIAAALIAFWLPRAHSSAAMQPEVAPAAAD